MTPEEKYAQVLRLAPKITDIARASLEKIQKRLRRAKTFPAFILSSPVEISGMGQWTILYEASSKAFVKKGFIYVRAFQTYYTSHAKSHINNGKGIYLLGADDNGMIQCIEYPPHYFNRLRERLIEPKGVRQPDFTELVKIMLRLFHKSLEVVTIGMSVSKDESGKYSFKKIIGMDKKKGYSNIVSFHKEGISLGVTVRRQYINFTTFVPNSLLRDGQKELQAESMKKMDVLEFRRRTDPSATLNNFELLDINTDI